ncbi:MAG: ATPase [Desulfurococcaceae archaeon]
MQILVTGLLPHESGKTTITLELSKRLRNRGYRVFYLKPVAGHSGWYQPDTLQYTAELGLLIGHDAYVVARELGLLSKIRLVNPLDVLTFPLDPLEYRRGFKAYVNTTMSLSEQAILARLSDPVSDIDTYFLFPDNVKYLSRYLRKVLESVLNNIVKARAHIYDKPVNFLEELLDNESIYNSIDRSLKSIIEEYDVIVIEGYNDVAAPTRLALESDIVLIASPSKLLIYPGSRYRMSVEALTPDLKTWRVKTSSVLDLAGKPMTVFDIPLKTDPLNFEVFAEKLVEFIIEAKM